MAIRIIEGVPGSGKSYYAVKHLADKYFEKQQDGRYELVKPVTIITNIDGFQPEHLDLRILVKDAGGVLTFFEESFQKELTERIGGQIVYIIDEAQKLFRKGDRTLSPVFSYFEYHRHFGHDIYLITQNAKKLPPDIHCLTEYLIVAAPRSRSVIGEFKYKWLSDGEILKREGFRPDQGIFALYKSMDQKESEKIKNPVMKTAALAVLASFFVLGGGLYYFKVKWLDPSSDKKPVSAIPSPVTGQAAIAQASGFPSSFTTRIVLSTTSVYIGESSGTFVLFNRKWMPLASFPHKTEKIMGTLYADVPSHLLEIEPPDKSGGESVRRTESASEQAHVPTSAAPAPVSG